MIFLEFPLLYFEATRHSIAKQAIKSGIEAIFSTFCGV